uniref:Uncharacterized protein n=1 Tax=Lutzomyia longipalpis TaxID=7200 RepID=A0A1B0C802_LUTLO
MEVSIEKEESFFDYSIVKEESYVQDEESSQRNLPEKNIRIKTKHPIQRDKKYCSKTLVRDVSCHICGKILRHLCLEIAYQMRENIEQTRDVASEEDPLWTGRPGTACLSSALAMAGGHPMVEVFLEERNDELSEKFKQELSSVNEEETNVEEILQEENPEILEERNLEEQNLQEKNLEGVVLVKKILEVEVLDKKIHEKKILK